MLWKSPLWLNEILYTKGWTWVEPRHSKNSTMVLAIHLYSCGVHPVGNVTHCHVHWQDDGLAVVVQARGGTLRPWGEAEDKLMAQPYLQTHMATMFTVGTAFFCFPEDSLSRVTSGLFGSIHLPLTQLATANSILSRAYLCYVLAVPESLSNHHHKSIPFFQHWTPPPAPLSIFSPPNILMPCLAH